MELPSIPALDKAIDEYVAIRDERMGLTKKEVVAQAALVGLMQEHKLTNYMSPDGFKADLNDTLKVKVSRPKEESSGEGDGDE